MDSLIKTTLFEGMKTERLSLRALTLDDCSDMYEYTSSPVTCKFLSWGPHTDISQAEDFLIKALNKYKDPTDIVWGIEEKTTGKMIGVVRIYSITADSATVSYILNEKFTGKGYMTEAVEGCIDICFEKLCCCVVNADFVEGNTASEHVMQRCKMEKTSLESTVEIKRKEYTLYTYERKR